MKKEMCVASLEGARLAAKYEVDRIETCIALEQGGLTPSEAMVKWIDQTFDLEQHVLIRQRAGGFNYNYDEVLVMRDQILSMKQLKVAGVVIGALTETMELDLAALENWKRAAGGLTLTFHRAFDEVKDWRIAMDQLIKLGFTRILTNGQAKNVKEGTETLYEMVLHAAGRIEIMAGGGLKSEDIPVMRDNGLSAVHFSATVATKHSEGSKFAEELMMPSEIILSGMMK